MNIKELNCKEKLEQLQIRKETVQLNIKKAVSARELFSTMSPMDEFDNVMIPRLIERIYVISKDRIKVVFYGGVEVEGAVEK